MVKMCAGRVSLIRSMMEASVVDFPDPVGPVTRTKPRGWRATISAAHGKTQFFKSWNA